eukprot:TRINITY_DN89980_c0_g1_i1.p1 TRINITY_DN89980_c0_g1~~TRINITY_DN89980_c0_g1_i1.p1  ORF type:complete len:405 (+),score=58.20 TRINITY_DN89980_c0_g1_i1:30-1244(+)
MPASMSYLQALESGSLHHREVENGLGQKARRPLQGRSLAIRVLGVVSAAIACLLEGQHVPESRDNEASTIAFSAPAKSDIIDAPHAFAGTTRSEMRSRLIHGSLAQTAPHMLLQGEQLAQGQGALGQHRVVSVLQSLIDSSIWMSASLASLVPFIQLSAGVSIDLRPFWAGFFESLVVYTLDHLRDLRRSQEASPRRMWLLKTCCFLGLAGFVAMVVAAPPGRHFIVALTYCLHLALCVVYAKLKPRMPYLKAAYVSLCVVFMAVAAPAAYDPALLSSFAPAALIRLVLVIMSVSFTVENLQDLRDIKEDREAGVVTIPSGLGVDWTKNFLLFSQFACVALQCCLQMAHVLPLRADMLLIHALCGICAMSFKENTPPYMFQVILEPLYVSPLAMLAVRSTFLHA